MFSVSFVFVGYGERLDCHPPLGYTGNPAALDKGGERIGNLLIVVASCEDSAERA
jgi:hypothetical protein